MTLDQALEWANSTLNERWRAVIAMSQAHPENYGARYEQMDTNAMDTLAAEVERRRAQTCATCRSLIVALPTNTCNVTGLPCFLVGCTCGAWAAREGETT